MKFTHIILLLAVTLLFTSVTSSARDRDSGFYFTGLLGYTFFDHERKLEDDPNIAGGFGYDFSKVWSAELVIGGADLEEKDTEADIDNLFGRLDALYHFSPESTWRPFIVGGVGHNVLEDKADNKTDETLFNLGVGLKHEISENMDVRFDARGLYSHDEESKDAALNLGFTYLFGTTGAAPADTDGDGVYDDEDLCPDTAYSMEVDSTGCTINADADGDGVADSDDNCPNTTAGTEVDDSGCPYSDSDGDGVADNLDQCPNTPANSPVNDVGCPLDEDHDGIHDGIDACPATPEGAKVDKRGCRIILEEAVSIRLQVNFPTNSAAVSDSYLPEIERLVEFMRQYPDTTVVVEGHTDRLGDAAYNQTLSERRAMAVRDIVVKRYNIDGSRISSVGYGASKPIAGNDKKAGRSMNRRVVAVIETVKKTAQ